MLVSPRSSRLQHNGGRPSAHPLSTHSGPMADPRTFANSNSAALRNPLLNDWHVDVFVSMVVIHNQDLLSDINVLFQMDSISRG